MSIQYHMFKPPFCIVSWFLILKAPLGTFSDSSSGDPGPRPAPVSWRQLGGQLGASPGPVPGNHKHVSRSMSRCWKHDTGHRMETIQQWTWAWDAPSLHFFWWELWDWFQFHTVTFWHIKLDFGLCHHPPDRLGRAKSRRFVFSFGLIWC